MSSTSPRDLQRSTALLVGANVVCAAVGALQGVLVLRMLGAELFGGVAVVVALTAVGANIVDVRLTDLVSKLYFDERAACPHTGAAYRAGALRFGLRLFAASAALIVVISCALLWLLTSSLTGVAMTATSLWVAAVAQGVSYFGAFFIFVQRFALSPRRMAMTQLASAAVNATAMLTFVATSATSAGYVAGLLASATGVTIVNAWQTITVLRRDGVRLVGRTDAAAPSLDYRGVLRFVAAGNLLGYVKLLHRSADVALVAAFCGDGQTGIYKLARSMTDSLQTISEAIGRVYQPRLLSLLQAGQHGEYAAIARWMAAAMALVTVVAIGTEVTLLPGLAPLLGVVDTHGLTVTVAILTTSFFFVAGLQSWIWPAFVYSGRLGRCTVWGVVGVLAGQYTIGPALVYMTGYATPAWFAIGFVSFYVLSVLPLWRELHQDGPVSWSVEEAPAA